MLQLKKLYNVRVTVIPIVVGALRTVPKRLERGLEELEIETTQTRVLVSPGELKRLVVTRTPLEDHQLMLV